MTPETIKLIIEIVAALGRRIVEAFENDDDEPMQRLADVLDEPTRLKLLQQHGIEKMRRAYRDGNG